ncbi:MAG: hypothetical protein ACK5IN_02590 [Microbacterium sp.]
MSSVRDGVSSGVMLGSSVVPAIVSALQPRRPVASIPIYPPAA